MVDVETYLKKIFGLRTHIFVRETSVFNSGNPSVSSIWPTMTGEIGGIAQRNGGSKDALEVFLHIFLETDGQSSKQMEQLVPVEFGDSTIGNVDVTWFKHKNNGITR